MVHRHTLTWIAIIGLIVLMFLRLPPMAATQDSLLHTYGPLIEVDALCRQQYVEAIRDDRLLEGAIRGMMLRLDPYSGYIAPDELSSFERRSRGDYSGVGIEVGFRDGRLTVIAPIEGSPAARAGVRPGDVIVSVNGVEVDGRSVFDVEEMLMGPPGTAVRLRMLRRSVPEPVTFKLKRGPVRIASVRGIARDGERGWDNWIDRSARVGYVRVSNFNGNTMDEFDAAMETLRAGRVAALVIDLRFNPGGLMTQAIAMVDRFVEEGVILSTITRRQAVEQYRARAGDTMRDVKLVVLINGGSASAAEIVSGSLQAHGRAVVVGERSFGKGSVQHVVHLTGREAAIKLTTAYYRLPDGRVIHRNAENQDSELWGVVPDVVVELNEEETHSVRETRRAIDMAYMDDDDSFGENGHWGENDRGDPIVRLPIDRQLAEALRVALEKRGG
jgi:carboxyl-terminal processing protease